MNETEQLQQAIAALEAQRTLLGDATVDAMQAPAREKLAKLEVDEVQQLQQAIATLEAQRSILGDATVDIMLAPAREKLAQLVAASQPKEPKQPEQPEQPEQQRKQATILFTDIAGHTALTRHLDPEENMEIIDGALVRLTVPIEQFGGHVARYQGDGFKAVFGLPVASEFDADNAVQAGLAMCQIAEEIAQELEQKWGMSGFAIRVGIASGLIFAGGETEGEDTIKGMTINLAARIESAAPPNAVVISPNTRELVRGVFNLDPLAPIHAKGFDELVPVYQVLSVKERTFHTRRRGVEGVTTQMVGRDTELKLLQDAYQTALDERSRRFVTVVGNAGIGKSRLLNEFERWVQVQETPTTFYHGRGRQQSEGDSYAFLRSIFSFLLDIAEDTPSATITRKLEENLTELLGEEVDANSKAAILGHLLGYDFSQHPDIKALEDNPQQLRDQALAIVIAYFKAAAERTPLLILLEDLHWADESSLQIVIRLTLALSHHAILFVALVRPYLFERHPDWLINHTFHQRLNLAPLSAEDSQQLLHSVLGKVQNLPSNLAALIIQESGGNPFYIEELVRMLLADGVIIKESADSWHVIPEKLIDLRVPPTLTGVLQARIDRLSATEKKLLQQASVAGHVFWEKIILYLNETGKQSVPTDVIQEGLDALMAKEMVYRSELSSFNHTNEHTFQHAILHTVAYKSVLIRMRRIYHGLIAKWLIQQQATSRADLNGLIADHFKQGGQLEEALPYLIQAGKSAERRYANDEAITFYTRALDLTPQSDMAAQVDLLLARESIYDLVAEREGQLTDLQTLLQHVTTTPAAAEHHATVLLRWGYYSRWTNDLPAAHAYCQQAITKAETMGNQTVALSAAFLQGRLFRLQQQYDRSRMVLLPLLTIAQERKLLQIEADCQLELATIALYTGAYQEIAEHATVAYRLYTDIHQEKEAVGALVTQALGQDSLDHYLQARQLLEDALAVCRTIGFRNGEVNILGNLGVNYECVGQYEEALQMQRQARQSAEEIGDSEGVSYALANITLLHTLLGEWTLAESVAEEALVVHRAIDDRRNEAHTHTYLGHALREIGRLDEATETYERAIAIRQELKELHLLIDDVAGLAAVALQSGAIDEAQIHAIRVWKWVETEGLEGMEHPLTALWHCYAVFQAGNDARSEVVLTLAQTSLKERAERIHDDESRETFLQNNKIHRLILVG